MRLKKTTLEELYKNKEGIEIMINVMEKTMALEPRTFEEMVCKEYIENQSVSKVAEILNGKEYKIRGRKYEGVNVSDVIQRADASVIVDLAKILFKHNNTLRNGNTSFNKKIEDFKELNNAQ